MRSEAVTLHATRGWINAKRDPAEEPGFQADLVIVFGAREVLAAPGLSCTLQQRYPGARVAGCSTGGQFVGADVTDSEVGVVAMHLERSRFKLVEVPIERVVESEAVGKSLGEALDAQDLKSVFVLADGVRINGSQMVAGLRSRVGPAVSITGGLAGDGARFEKTLLMLDGSISGDRLVGIGFYGEAFRVGHGCRNGWSEFGPRRTVSKAQENVLYELDGKPALELYKRYLGAEAADLPASGLLYPIMLINPENPEHRIIRTVMGVNDEDQSLTFAGDMPEGWHAQLMRGHFDRLTDAAGEAAAQAMLAAQGETAAILISCIGRRLVLGENTIDEISAAREGLGTNVASAGFYSYGEIAPHAVSGRSELHNQTMTVTTFSEAP